MSHNRLTFEGLSELREALRNLPDDLRGEARHIVEAAANGAAAQIQGAYAVDDGDLRDGVYVRPSEVGTFGAGAIVVSKAPHAHLYEFGSQVRRTKAGANRGAMPPKPTFVPIVIRKRRQMQEQLIDLLVRHGLVVSGG